MKKPRFRSEASTLTHRCQRQIESKRCRTRFNPHSQPTTFLQVRPQIAKPSGWQATAAFRNTETRSQLSVKFAVLLPHLDERQRRLLMAAEARVLGHGGVRAVALAAAVSETTVRKGVFELEAGEEPLGRVRRPGGGRKRVADLDPGLRRLC